MKLLEKSLKKVLIEISIKDITNQGFDKVWDKLRDAYPKKEYTIERISINEEEKIIHVSLKKKLLLNSQNQINAAVV